jgi:hypothetical protein
MEMIAGIIQQAPVWLLAISGLISALTVITAMTPSKLDDAVLGKATKYVNFALKLINMGAGNVGKNKNMDADKASK